MKVKTPCVGRCSVVFGDIVCRGCKRTMEEVNMWNRYGSERKQFVIARINNLLGRAVLEHLVITTPYLVDEELEKHGIPDTGSISYGRKAFILLHLVPIYFAVNECGIEVLPAYTGMTARELIRSIETLQYKFTVDNYTDA